MSHLILHIQNCIYSAVHSTNPWLLCRYCTSPQKSMSLSWFCRCFFYFDSQIFSQTLALFKVFFTGLILNTKYRVNHFQPHFTHLLCDHHRCFTAPSIRAERCSDLTIHIPFREALNKFFHWRKHLVMESR